MGTDQDLGKDKLPIGIFGRADLDDLVAGLNARFFSGTARANPAHHGGLIQVERVLVVHHVNTRQQPDRQHDVHEAARPGRSLLAATGDGT